MQKRLFAAAVAAVISFGGAASAADVYHGDGYKDGPAYVPVNSWTGFYFGANGGYAWANDNSNITSFVEGEPLLTSSGFDSKGAFGGAQVGYNWQSGNFVLGFETDLQGADIQSDKNVVPFPGINRHLTQNIDWFGTVRGRVGYAFDRTLLYFTGGFAYGNVNSSINTSLLGVIPIARLNNNDTQTGFTVGGGLEYRFNPAWSLKAEYQYIDLGSDHLNGNIAAIVPINTNDLNTNFHTIRIGINYRVGSVYEPLK